MVMTFSQTLYEVEALRFYRLDIETIYFDKDAADFGFFFKEVFFISLSG